MLDRERKLLHISSPPGMSRGKFGLTIKMLQCLMIRIQDELIIGEVGTQMLQGLY